MQELNIGILLISICALLVAIIGHEIMHGLAALYYGDDTAKLYGRISINPIKHIDLVGSIILPIGLLLLQSPFMFGWAKPVPINIREVIKNGGYNGAIMVSLAGIIYNFLLAIIFAIIYYGIYKFAGISFMMSTTGGIIMSLISATVSINVGLGLFNLIPLPPLDGSKVIMPFLPFNAKQFFINNEQIFYIVFVVLWITGLTSYIITPGIQAVGGWISNLAAAIWGL